MRITFSSEQSVETLLVAPEAETALAAAASAILEYGFVDDGSSCGPATDTGVIVARWCAKDTLGHKGISSPLEITDEGRSAAKEILRQLDDIDDD